MLPAGAIPTPEGNELFYWESSHGLMEVTTWLSVDRATPGHERE